jgi:hypothetical protein
MQFRGPTVAFAVLLVSATAEAQGYRDLDGPSFRDFQIVRARPRPYARSLTIRGGLAGVIAADEDPARGQEDTLVADGFVWYQADKFTEYEARLDAYAGRDGAFVSLIQDQLTDSGGGRLELSTRYFPFYREGYYDGSDWQPTGRYEGRDYGAYLGFTSRLGEGVVTELGPFYRSYSFERNDTTDPGYTIPEDFDAYGLRFHFEQSTLTLDRRTGLPEGGFLASVHAEYELNNADGSFGTERWSSELPSTFWRGGLRLEWYFPTGGGDAWEFRLNGEINDEKDRIHNFDAQKPIGQYWGDARFGYRLGLGSSIYLTPFGHLQYTRTPDVSGSNASDDFWFGGGIRGRFDLGDVMSVLGEYSYLSNPNRPSVSWQDDLSGEHQFFIGAELRFGASRY